MQSEVEFIASETSLAPKILLRLIATSDLHACLLPYDYRSDTPVAGLGLGEVSRQIAQARAEVPNSLLLDNGDFLQGSPLADFVASTARRRRAHPVIAAFNALEYDAVTLGNHEFDYGLNFLGKALSRARFPIVSANTVTKLGADPAQDQTLVPPYAILRRRVVDTEGRTHVLRIGVIGFAPSTLQVWDHEHRERQIHVRDIVDAARAWLPLLRQAGADVIVALAHTGIGSMTIAKGDDNAATALAALPEIDAVIAGHSHQTFPGPDFAGKIGVDPVRGLLAGKPAVMPGHSGRQIGIIDLQLSPLGLGKRRWQVASGQIRLGVRSAGAAALAPGLRRAIAPDHRATLAWSRQRLGETRVPLTTSFATSAPTAAMALIAKAKADHARKCLADTGWAELPVVATAAPFRAGGMGGPLNYTDIPAGAFKMRNIADLYSFANSLVALEVTASLVANWLERSASIFNQIAPGAVDAPLHDPSFPSFNFDCIPGLTYAIDLSQPAPFDHEGRLIRPKAARVVGLSLGGLSLKPDARMILVTNSHRASLAMCEGAKVVLGQGTRVQAAIADYVKTNLTVGEAPERNWHFLPMPGSTVRVATGPAGEAQLADIAHMRPQLIARDELGFLHYRLHL